MRAEQSPPRATIVLPAPVVKTLERLAGAVGPGVVVVGGWAVACRLKMARSGTRPTDDVDVILHERVRPARAALAAVDALQADHEHPCRLAGLPLVVDLLAEPVDEAGTRFEDECVEDVDGLRLLIPPFGGLLVRTAEWVRLVDAADTTSAIVGLPLAGALFAAKAANVALGFRSREKQAGDAEDAVRLLEAFGTLALLEDLAAALPWERTTLHRHLEALGPGGLAGPARDAGHHADRDRLTASVADLLADLV